MLPLHEDSRTGSISKQVLKPEFVADTYYHPSSQFSFCAFRLECQGEIRFFPSLPFSILCMTTYQ